MAQKTIFRLRKWKPKEDSEMEALVIPFRHKSNVGIRKHRDNYEVLL
jgi:hypothetical protein